MKKQKLMRNLFMAGLLFGGIFIAGAGSNVYAESGGLIGSGTRSDGGGGTIGSGTRTGEDNESTGVTSQTVGSGGRVAEPDDTAVFFWQSVWRLFI